MSAPVVCDRQDMRLTDALVRMPLGRQIFLAAAVVLGAVTAALALSPITISAPMTWRELAWAAGILAGVLLLLHVAVRRLLAPLHRLADAMGEIDPREPSPGLHARIAPDDRDVARLLGAFEGMLARFREERLESDRRTAAAQEAERRLVAGEVHDQLGQTLTALSLQLERAEMAERDRAALRETIARALDDVRGIARRLRPEGLDDLGLVNALIALATRVQEDSGVPVERRIDAPLPPLPADAELAIYRIAQEALTNAIRHADARRVCVRLAAGQGEVTLVVDDNGRGFIDPPPPDGGIAGMRERARLAGAALQVESDTMRGTRVRCAVPTAGASA
ncbi:sensor histidine kinase [Patulibacter sp. SYSU D01012]|uniref:ATP-binding protein n=1 Tax=Patulibacter sp. SYSU D01012 TaxID=2817381 RepID=UPI001B315831